MFPKVLSLLVVAGLTTTSAWADDMADYEACLESTAPPSTYGGCESTSFTDLETALTRYSAKAVSSELADVQQVVDHQCAFVTLLHQHLQHIYLQDHCYQEHVGPLSTSLDEMPSLGEIRDTLLVAVEQRATALLAPEKTDGHTSTAAESTVVARRVAPSRTVSSLGIVKDTRGDPTPSRAYVWDPHDPLDETGSGPSLVEDFDANMDWDKDAWGPSIFNMVLHDFGVAENRGRWTIIYPNDAPESPYSGSCQFISHWTKIFMDQTNTEAFIVIDVSGASGVPGETVLAQITGWGTPVPGPFGGEWLFEPLVELVAGPIPEGGAVSPLEWWTILLESAVPADYPGNWWSSDVCVNSLIDP